MRTTVSRFAEKKSVHCGKQCALLRKTNGNFTGFWLRLVNVRKPMYKIPFCLGRKGKSARQQKQEKHGFLIRKTQIGFLLPFRLLLAGMYGVRENHPAFPGNCLVPHRIPACPASLLPHGRPQSYGTKKGKSIALPLRTPSGIRTLDPLIKSQLLYQLS